MKSVLFLMCFVALIGCKSNKSSNASSNKTEEATEIVPLEKAESQKAVVEEISEPASVAEPVIFALESSSSIIGKWRIISIKESGKTVDLPYLSWDMQLTFEEENEKVGIKSPCNSGWCNYDLNNKKISIQTNCGFTEMYCEEEQKNIWEKKLVDVLANQSEITTLDKITLKLNGSTYSVELSRI